MTLPVVANTGAVAVGRGVPSRAQSARYAFDLVTHLVAREFRLRYKQAVLGWLWALGEPLARLVIMSVVFTSIINLDIPNYPVFLFSGLIAWMWFTSGVGSAASSALQRRDLLFRPEVPRYTIPIVSVLTDFLDYLAALPVLVVFLLLTGGIPVTAAALPAVLAVQLLLMLGLGFALCAANVYLRDVHLFVNLALMLGFFVTPVFYHRRTVPEHLSWVVQYNPMAHLLDAYRGILLEGRWPDPGSFLLLTCVCAAICCAGFAIYQKVSPSFVDEL